MTIFDNYSLRKEPFEVIQTNWMGGQNIAFQPCTFQIWSQFDQIKAYKRCQLLNLDTWMTVQHFQASIECFWVPTRDYWVPFEGNLVQLFRDFKTREKIKYKAQCGKCALQSYKFQINLHRTETSVTDHKFAQVVAYLCWESCIESCEKVVMY